MYLFLFFSSILLCLSLLVLFFYEQKFHLLNVSQIMYISSRFPVFIYLSPYLLFRASPQQHDSTAEQRSDRNFEDCVDGSSSDSGSSYLYDEEEVLVAVARALKRGKKENKDKKKKHKRAKKDKKM